MKGETMDIPQKIALYTAVALLLLALLRFQVDRFTKARTRNTISIDIDCDVAEAREGIRQLTADVERLHGQVKAARKDLAALKADRDVIGLPVWKVTTEPARRQQPPRKSPPAPAPNAAPQKKRTR